jgi:hypothetical protein
MHNYLIIREGRANSCNANGPLTIVGARTEREARLLAEELVGPTYNGQYLVATVESRAKVKDWNEASDRDSLKEAHQSDCVHDFTDTGYQDFCTFCGISKASRGA